MKKLRKLEELRKKAEQIVKEKGLNNSIDYINDIEKLVEELNIYQIELEMQNQELHRTNEKLTIEQNKYKELYQNAPIAYFTLNKTGNIIELNNAAANLLEIPIHQFQYTSIFPYISPKKRIDFVKQFKKLFQSKNIEYGEVTFINSKGKELQTKLNSICYFDPQFEQKLCRCTITNITQLKKELELEKKLKKEQEKNEYFIKELLSNISDTVFLTDYHYNFTFICPNVEFIFEYNQSEVAQMQKITKLINQITHINKNELKKNNEISNLECQITDKSGNTHTVLISAKCINIRGKEILYTCRDITKRKKSEIALEESQRKYSTLFKESLHPILIINLTGKIIQFNKAAYELVEYTHDEYEKLHISDIDALQNKETIIKQINRTLKEKKVVFETQHKTKSGKLLDIVVNAAPITIKNGQFILASFHNVTHLKNALATKDKLFSIISHDLKNPFNSLLGFTELLLKKYNTYDDEKRLKFIGLINESSENVCNLLNNLLAWSSSQNDKIELYFEPVNLKYFAYNTVNFVQSFALKKEIEIHQNIPKTIFVSIDKATIDTVLRNLITNAIKFTNRNGKITISAQILPDNNKFIEISVKDTGIGIPPEKLKTLFAIKKSKSTQGTEKELGTGLGLIVCKEFVEKNGGKIYVESEVGKGSCFKFTLKSISPDKQYSKTKTLSNYSF